MGFRVSRDRGSPCWQGLSMNWRLQNPKGFREIYTQIWPRSKYHRPRIVKPLCDLSSLWGEMNHWGSALHVNVFESGNQLFENPLILHFWLLATLGLLYRFLTTSLGCYSLKRSCNLSVVRWLNVESSNYDFDGWASELHSVGVDNV